jgi:hypothetical protein
MPVAMGAGFGWDGVLGCDVRVEREEALFAGAGLLLVAELLFCAVDEEALREAAFTGFFLAEVVLLDEDVRVSLLGMGIGENPFRQSQSLNNVESARLEGHYSTHGLIHLALPRRKLQAGVRS